MPDFVVVLSTPPAWLTSALRQRFQDATVKGVEVIDVMNGTNTKIRLRLDLDEAAKAAGVPQMMILKTGFEPAIFWADSHYRGARCIVANLLPFSPDHARPFLERRFRQIAKKAVVRAWEARRGA